MAPETTMGTLTMYAILFCTECKAEAAQELHPMSRQSYLVPVLVQPTAIYAWQLRSSLYQAPPGTGYNARYDNCTIEIYNVYPAPKPTLYKKDCFLSCFNPPAVRSPFDQVAVLL